MTTQPQESVSGSSLRYDIVVLDTNVVLDWMLFRDPRSSALGAALAHGRLRWIATAAMRAELEHVVARGHLDRWQPDLGALHACWQRHCNFVDAPAPSASPANLRCTDPDDQPFIDLAVAAGAQWLLSRDRAVLKLARRLRQHGVVATTPEAWSAAFTAPD